MNSFLPLVAEMKARLEGIGYCFYGDEPMKITFSAKEYGYTGTQLADILSENNIFCEFCDPDYLVLMPTPETTRLDLEKIEAVLGSIEKREPIKTAPPQFVKTQKALTIREAALSPSKTLPISECEGKILSAVTVSCPPAVPILVCGEKITKEVLDCFRYYGVTECSVIAD